MSETVPHHTISVETFVASLLFTNWPEMIPSSDPHSTLHAAVAVTAVFLIVCPRMATADDGAGMTEGLPSWLAYVLITILVMMSGLFSGLTLGLLGLDVNGLQVRTIYDKHHDRLARTPTPACPQVCTKLVHASVPKCAPGAARERRLRVACEHKIRQQIHE